MQKLHPSPSTGFAEEARAIFEKARSRENLEICDQVSDAAIAVWNLATMQPMDIHESCKGKSHLES